MSAQQAVSPYKQLPIKHSPKSTEKTKASPNKKAVMNDLLGLASKKQKVVSDADNGKHTPKNGGKSQQTAEKNGGKKPQTTSKGTATSKAQPQIPNSSNGISSIGATAQSKQKVCFNNFCTKDKNLSSGSPQQELTRKQGGNGGYKQLKLEKSGEKVNFCELCCSRYQERHFCYYCQQVYFDEYNIDEKDWIQCDQCDRWCHLHCEDEKIKKVLLNSSSDNVPYDCPRCRGKETATPQAQSSTAQQQTVTEKASTTKQTQNNLKAQKDKVIQNQTPGGSKVKKQGKLKEKEDKKQEQVEQQAEIQQNGHLNGQNTIQPTQQQAINPYSIQTQRMDSILQSNLKKATAAQNSVNRDTLQQNQNDQEIYYSFDNFKRKKNKTFQNQQQQTQLYQPVYQPITLLPNYSTIDDLLKSSGISFSLDEGSIKRDLSELKKMLMESSDSSFLSNSSMNQSQNKVHNHINGQNYSIIVNQE